jgi:voltage-gated potassium channel
MHEREPAIWPVWDAIVVLSTTYAALYIPHSLLHEAVPGSGSWSQWIITAIFVADLIVRIVRVRSMPHSKRSRIPPAAWLLIDLIAAIPFGLLPLPSILELLRLAKLVRVGQMMTFLRRRLLRQYNQLGFAFFTYWLFLSFHWIACGWVALRTVSGGDSTAYLDALYWALSTLTTVGYGDVTPSNSAQKIYAMGVMIVGIGVYGFIVANLATLLANIDPARRNYSRSMERLSSFMYYRNIPDPLQRRIREYYEYVWEKRIDYDESDILLTLPPSLAVDVSMFLKRDIIERVPLFSGASDAFIREIASQLQPIIFTPGDLIMRRGERGTDMYFISRGTVDILAQDNESVIATLGDGDFFGEIALFLNLPRTATARAVDYCDLYRLDKEMFNRVISHFPEVGEQIREKADRRFRKQGEENEE